jgi:hypothetical protein
VELALRNERVIFIANRLEAVESVNMGVPMMFGPSAAKCRREFAKLAEFCGGRLMGRAVTASSIGGRILRHRRPRGCSAGPAAKRTANQCLRPGSHRNRSHNRAKPSLENAGIGQ